MRGFAWWVGGAIGFFSQCYGGGLSESELRYLDQTRWVFNEADYAWRRKDMCWVGDEGKAILDISQMTCVGRVKPGDGATQPWIYLDKAGVKWYVKRGQCMECEYVGAKLMQMVLGPSAAQVRLARDERGYLVLASREIVGFEKAEGHLDRVKAGDAKGWIFLQVVSEWLGLGDGHSKNVGFYRDYEGEWVAARVDYDSCFIGNDPRKWLVWSERYIGKSIKKYGVQEVKEAFLAILAVPEGLIRQAIEDAKSDLVDAGYALPRSNNWIDLGRVFDNRNKIKDTLERFESLVGEIARY